MIEHVKARIADLATGKEAAPGKAGEIQVQGYNVMLGYYHCLLYTSELDAEFHKIMIDSVSRSAMMQMLDSLMLHLSRWRNFDVAFDNRVPQLIAEHKKIFEAIEDVYKRQRQRRSLQHR